MFTGELLTLLMVEQQNSVCPAPETLTHSLSLLSRSYNSIPKHRFGSNFAEFIF